MSDIRRGEIFYISRGGMTTHGNEQFADRPAVVVSNDKNNENSGVIEVVYMTTQPKTDLPTHVTVRSTGRISTVLCEQVYSVAVERVGTYIGQCSDAEMQNIDIALMISLQLDGNTKTSKKYTETIAKQEEEIKGLREQFECAKACAEELRKELKCVREDAERLQEHKRQQDNTKASDEQEQENPAYMTQSEALIRTETERDTYKALYEQLFNKIVNGGKS